MTRYLNLMRNITNWSLYLGIKFGFTQPDPIHFITRTGVVVEVPRRLLQTFKEVFMDECYMNALQRSVPKGGSVIDIGANSGFFPCSPPPDSTTRAFSAMNPSRPISNNWKRTTN